MVAILVLMMIENVIGILYTLELGICGCDWFVWKRFVVGVWIRWDCLFSYWYNWVVCWYAIFSLFIVLLFKIEIKLVGDKNSIKFVFKKWISVTQMWGPKEHMSEYIE